MAANHSSYWNNFFESLQSDIPFIDSDSSSSITSENEDVMIFRQPTTLPPIEDILLDEELSSPARMVCSAESLYEQKWLFKQSRPESIAKVQQVTTFLTMDSENKIPDLNSNVKPKSPQKKDDNCAPVLSFSLLDGWDLDSVLHNLRRNGPASREHEFPHVIQSLREADNQSPGDRIMERLVSISKQQQQSSRLTPEPLEPEPIQSATHPRESIAMSDTNAMTVLEISRQESRPTVYIDLRHQPTPSGKASGRFREVLVECKTEAKLGRHQGEPPETRVGQGGQQDRSRLRTGGESGMSMLLREMREQNKCRKDEFKEPSLKLENDTKECTEKTLEPVAPTWRPESLVSHTEEGQCGAKKSKTTEISTTTSMTHTSKPKNPKSVERSQACTAAKSPSLQCATNKADVLLLVAPAVAPCCWGLVLFECVQRGFTLRGVQRLQLIPKAAKALGLTSSQVLLFCKSPTATPGGKKTTLSSHCLVLLLKRENATHHCASLPAALMKECEAQDLLCVIGSVLNGVHVVEPSSCFHVSPYTDRLRNNLVGAGEVVILSLCGHDLRQGLALLHRILRGAPGDDGGGEGGAVDIDEGCGWGGSIGGGGLELLDLTWLPVLTTRQARELSPYEVGERGWPGSLDTLASAPALVCALRGVDAFTALRTLLPPHGGCDGDPGRLSVLMSPTPELALRQALLFFPEGETIPPAGFVSNGSTMYS
ncbi:unnamed protein product [Boreogadus saida]